MNPIKGIHVITAFDSVREALTKKMGEYLGIARIKDVFTRFEPSLGVNVTAKRTSSGLVVLIPGEPNAFVDLENPTVLLLQAGDGFLPSMPTLEHKLALAKHLMSQGLFKPALELMRRIPEVSQRYVMLPTAELRSLRATSPAMLNLESVYFDSSIDDFVMLYRANFATADPGTVPRVTQVLGEVTNVDALLSEVGYLNDVFCVVAYKDIAAAFSDALEVRTLNPGESTAFFGSSIDYEEARRNLTAGVWVTPRADGEVMRAYAFLTNDEDTSDTPQISVRAILQRPFTTNYYTYVAQPSYYGHDVPIGYVRLVIDDDSIHMDRLVLSESLVEGANLAGYATAKAPYARVERLVWSAGFGRVVGVLSAPAEEGMAPAHVPNPNAATLSRAGYSPPWPDYQGNYGRSHHGLSWADRPVAVGIRASGPTFEVVEETSNPDQYNYFPNDRRIQFSAVYEFAQNRINCVHWQRPGVINRVYPSPDSYYTGYTTDSPTFTSFDLAGGRAIAKATFSAVGGGTISPMYWGSLTTYPIPGMTVARSDGASFVFPADAVGGGSVVESPAYTTYSVAYAPVCVNPRFDYLDQVAPKVTRQLRTSDALRTMLCNGAEWYGGYTGLQAWQDVTSFSGDMFYSPFTSATRWFMRDVTFEYTPLYGEALSPIYATLRVHPYQISNPPSKIGQTFAGSGYVRKRFAGGYAESVVLGAAQNDAAVQVQVDAMKSTLLVLKDIRDRLGVAAAHFGGWLLGRYYVHTEGSPDTTTITLPAGFISDTADTPGFAGSGVFGSVDLGQETMVLSVPMQDAVFATFAGYYAGSNLRWPGRLKGQYTWTNGTQSATLATYHFAKEPEGSHAAMQEAYEKFAADCVLLEGFLAGLPSNSESAPTAAQDYAKANLGKFVTTILGDDSLPCYPGKSLLAVPASLFKPPT